MERELILLIDDDAPSRRIIKLILEQEGFHLMEASSRDDAVQVVEESKPGLIMMDYLMPGLPPSEFIEKVRGTGYAGPIVLCTAMKKNLDLEVDGVVYKPFNPDHLASQVKALMTSWAVAKD